MAEVKGRIKIIGWKTPKTPANAPFGMTMPKQMLLEKTDVPRSATAVFALDMGSRTCKILELKPEELGNYKLD